MKIKFSLILFFMIFLIGCASQEFGSLNFSDTAKEELRQLLQKTLPDTFDVTYSFHSSLGTKSLADITFRNAKQGKNQRQDIFGNVFGYNLSAYSVTNDGKQVTCALFDNEWKCSFGDEVCVEKDKVKICHSVSQEGIPPTIKPELLAKAKVAKAESKQILGMRVQCYKLLTTEGGNKALTEVCFNQDGIIMLMGISAGVFEMRIEAESFSTNVQPELFVVPISFVPKSVQTTQTLSKKVSNISVSSLHKVNITIISNPPDADIYLDDEFIGKAPFTKQMPTGIYLVRCVLDGYADSYTSVGVTEAGAGAEHGVVGAAGTCNMKPLITQR